MTFWALSSHRSIARCHRSVGGMLGGARQMSDAEKDNILPVSDRCRSLIYFAPLRSLSVVSRPSDILGKYLRALLQNLLHDRNLARLLARRRSRSQTQSHHQLPLREGVPIPALSGGARVAPLSLRGREMHRLQAVRGGVSGAGHHDRRGGEGGWGEEDYEIRY